MKRFTTRLVITLVIVLMMTGTVFAGGADFAVSVEQNSVKMAAVSQDVLSYEEEVILQIAEKANADVEKEIAKAQIKAEKAKNDDKIDIIIEKLLAKTEMIVTKAIIKIEGLGGEAVCEYIEIEIGGKTVLVDPIRIVRL